MKTFKEYIILYLILALYSICWKNGEPAEYEHECCKPCAKVDLPEFHLN